MTCKRYGQFFEKALLDGRIRVISFRLNKDRSVTAVIPHFWTEAGVFVCFTLFETSNQPTELDPNFSVLLGEENKNKSCDSVHTQSTHGLTRGIIAAFFSVFGLAIFVALFVRFFVPKLRLAYQLRKHRPRNNEKGLKHIRSELEEENEIEIERAADMEMYTEAGKFVVRM